MTTKDLKDYTGLKVGKWTVLGMDTQFEGNHSRWIVECECGTRRTYDSDSLRRGVRLGCKGCTPGRSKAHAIMPGSEMPAKVPLVDAPDLTGMRFGRLTVVCHISKTSAGKTTKKNKWLCRCDCGDVKEVQDSNLRKGMVRSCGAIGKCYGKGDIPYQAPLSPAPPVPPEPPKAPKTPKVKQAVEQEIHDKAAKKVVDDLAADLAADLVADLHDPRLLEVGRAIQAIKDKKSDLSQEVVAEIKAMNTTIQEAMGVIASNLARLDPVEPPKKKRWFLF